MARQQGLIRLNGTLGGITFYQTSGADLARVANGPSKEKINSDPAFARTRENNAEFGGAARMGKAVRVALSDSKLSKADAGGPARLTKLFKEINLMGTGPRGQRPIELSAHRVLLINYEFNSRVSFGSVFTAPYTVSHNTARDEGTITVPGFLPDIYLDAPAGATHFRLVSALGLVSDYVYNTQTRMYEAADATLDMIGEVENGAMTSLTATAPVNFTLQVTLPVTPAAATNVSIIQCLGIEFFQRVGSTDYRLAQGDCMKVVGVF